MDARQACAPRYVHFTTNRRRRDPVGTCYLSRGSFTGFLEYSPCRTLHGWGYHKQGSCQAGFSAAISRDGSRAFIGAPGSWYWQGQVYSQNLLATPHLPDGDEEAPLATRESPMSDDDTYLGYALAIGRFSASEELDVAIGVPKGDNLTGKVVIMSSDMHHVIQNVSGEQVGSYFGHSLTTADVNGDGLDDLVVGAPLFALPDSKDASFEQGRIYVILQNRDHSFVVKSKIDGRRSRARLGSALTSLSDLNKDGYDGEKRDLPHKLFFCCYSCSPVRTMCCSHTIHVISFFADRLPLLVLMHQTSPSERLMMERMAVGLSISTMVDATASQLSHRKPFMLLNSTTRDYERSASLCLVAWMLTGTSIQTS